MMSICRLAILVTLYLNSIRCGTSTDDESKFIQPIIQDELNSIRQQLIHETETRQQFDKDLTEMMRLYRIMSIENEKLSKENVQLKQDLHSFINMTLDKTNELNLKLESNKGSIEYILKKQISQQKRSDEGAQNLSQLEKEYFELRHNMSEETQRQEELSKDIQEAINHSVTLWNDTISSVVPEISILKKGFQSTSVSSIYTRWGKTTCPNHTELVYSGLVGGSRYDQKGGAAEPLCMPKDPEWGLHTDRVDGSKNYLYGAEYEFHTMPDSRKSLMEQDVPCAVCKVKKRSSVMMLPARQTCYAGWDKEYQGYLMAGYYDHDRASKFICLDEHPDTVPGGQANKNGYLLYAVEGYLPR